MEKLERQKLELEIKKLNIPWYKNIEFWKTVIPTVAILFSLYFTFGKSLLDSEKQKLEIQKEGLKLEILQFERKKESIIDSISVKNVERNKLALTIANYKSIKDSLSRALKLLNQRSSVLKTENQKLKDYYSNEKSFYLTEIKKNYQNERNNAKQIQNLYQKLSEVALKNSKLEAEISFRNDWSKLSAEQERQLFIIKTNIESTEYLRRANSTQKNVKKILEDNEKQKKSLDTMSDSQAIHTLEMLMMKSKIQEDK